MGGELPPADLVAAAGVLGGRAAEQPSLAAKNGASRPVTKVSGEMHNPQRDPFYEGLWADIQEGVEAADRGDLVDGEDAFRELLGEEPAIVEN